MYFRISLTLFTLAFGLTNDIKAQDYSAYDCPVEELGKTLKYPWTGGFSAPQFSTGDLNNDGKAELFVFDRAGSVPLVFEREGLGSSEAYTYRPALKLPLPDTLVSWALVRDYNRDGIADLFVAPTYASISGVQLYVGSYENGELTYTLKRIGNPNGSFDIIWYRLGSNWVNISVPFGDVPEIIDIDGDTDLDIISFDSEGSYVTYYRNLQEEEGLSKDELKFEAADFCFGKFKEAGLSGDIFLSDDSSKCAARANQDDPTKGGAHAGSTLMCFDNDDDGDMEIMIGDLSSPTLTLLTNGGSNQDNFMTSVMQKFPDYDISAEMDVFLGSYNVDIDGDGLKDIIAAPNATKSIQNVDNIWVYRNNGESTNRFRLKQKDFLQDQSIDLGSLSVPNFMDENADGLMDLMVASGGYYEREGNTVIFLSLYRNVGDKDNPSFKLVDNDYLGFSQYSNSSDNPSPTVGDLDSDGDIDILIGDTQGSLFYYQNTAGPGEPMDFGNPQVGYMDIDLGQRGRPAIEDINGDGLADIIIGERLVNGNFTDPENPTFGSIAYYQNLGTVGAPLFNPVLSESPNVPNLGQIRTQPYAINNASPNSSAPHFITVGEELQILLGSEEGNIKRYCVDRTNLAGQFILLDSILGGIDEGNFSTISTYDIDNDGFLELLVGNLRGGLGFYNTPIFSEFSSTSATPLEEVDIVVTPNPFNSTINIDFPKTLNIKSITLFSSNGQQVKSFNSQCDYKLDDLASGLYYLQILSENNAYVKKIMKY